MSHSTFRNIAGKAGVSVSTVQRALSGSGPVADATRERVLQAAAELDYRPNRLAQALRKGRSRVLGVVVWAGGGGWDAALLQGVESAARGAGYLLMLGFNEDDPDREREPIEAICDFGVDGLIVIPTQPSTSADLYARLQRTGPPLVFAVEPGPIPADIVQTDHLQGGYLVARHLIEQRCREVVFLCNESSYDLDWGRARLAGLAQALQEAGLPEPTVLTVPDAGRALAGSPQIRSVLEQHLSRGGRMDALFGVHDWLALQALTALAQMGLRVPQDVAVAGFDDRREAALSDPPLTSARQELWEIGVRSVRLLLSRIEGTLQDPEPVRQYVPGPLIVRASTDRQSGCSSFDRSDLARDLACSPREGSEIAVPTMSAGG